MPKPIEIEECEILMTGYPSFGDSDLQAYLDLYRSLSLQGVFGRAIENNPSLTEIRLGGTLIWPNGQSLPKAANGRPFVQLLLVDLASLPPMPRLPRDGHLQILIEDDDLFGMPTSRPDDHGSYKVIHHSASTTFAEIGRPSANAMTPFAHEALFVAGMGLEWKEVVCPPSSSDFRLVEFRESKGSPSEEQWEEIYEVRKKTLDYCGQPDVRILGHPEFAQDDWRSSDHYGDWINLVGFSGIGGAMSWGDAGEANFLIAPVDLEARRFDRVEYSWDCY